MVDVFEELIVRVLLALAEVVLDVVDVVVEVIVYLGVVVALILFVIVEEADDVLD